MIAKIEMKKISDGRQFMIMWTIFNWKCQLFPFNLLIRTFFIFFFYTQNNEVMEKCMNLFQLDYNVVELSNRAGELSSHYPSLIIIPENEKQTSTIPNTNCCFSSFFAQAQNPASSANSTNSSTTTSTPSTGARTQQETIYESSYDATKLKELIGKARFARSRTRFPIPVILYKGKYVCRSSTLSSGPEMYTRTSFNYLFNSTTKATNDVDTSQDGRRGELDNILPKTKILFYSQNRTHLKWRRASPTRAARGISRINQAIQIGHCSIK